MIRVCQVCNVGAQRHRGSPGRPEARAINRRTREAYLHRTRRKNFDLDKELLITFLNHIHAVRLSVRPK